MKLKYLFSSVLAFAFLFAGCDKNFTDSFDNIKLSKTYLSIPEDGGSAELTITATEDWEFVSAANWPEVVTFAKDADGKAYKAKYDFFGFLVNPDSEIESRTPSWLKVNVMKGNIGETKVVFSAEAVQGGRELEIAIKAGESTKQLLKIRQGSMGSVSATCKEIIDGPDGKTYTVSGTCTAIANTTYGNWYLNDGTGEIYIYGTLDKDGAAKNFLSLGIEVGDVIEVTGPKTTYNTTVELVDVTVNKITKSLVQVMTAEQTIAKEGGEFDVIVSYKGENLTPTVPAEYRSWVSVVDMKINKGIPTKIEQNPADTAVVTLYVPANETGLREASVEFTCGKTTVPYSFKQDGSIIETTADKINAAEDGATLYRLTGYITKDEGNAHGNIHVKDATGEVYCYGVLNDKGEVQKWKEMGISEGDIVTVVGPKTSYNGAPQLKNVSVEKHIKVSDISIADFRNLPDDKNTWYRISGKVGKSNESGTKYDLDANGYFALFDGSNEVYVFGVRAGWGGEKGEFGKLGVKEGDNLTIVCYKNSYNGLNEADGCFYVSHEAGQGENPGNGGKYVKVTSAPADWSGKYLIVFGDNAHATISGKDLKETAAVTVSDNAIASSSAVDAAAVTVAKNGSKYSIALPDGKYFGMAHNSCASSEEPYDVDFEYTSDGIKIAGAVSGKTDTYYLYNNNGSYFRCYVDKTGLTGYSLPVLYKYAE